VRNEASRHGESGAWPTSLHPTPYEIFNLARGAPYSKRRFIELAKLYHPDRHTHNTDDGIPHRTKLERYRLIVTAHEILSDPERRRLYDSHGAGWEAHAAPDSARAADRAWLRQAGNASMNGTWEDWERWYQERDGKEKQEPVFVSNGGFVTIVVLLALIGGWGHVTRAGANASKLMDVREEQHVSAAKAMRQRQNQSIGLNKEERVRYFLQQREGWGYDAPVSGHPPPDLRGVERLEERAPGQ